MTNGVAVTEASLDREVHIPYVKWDSHFAWLRKHFEVGQHVSAIVPTGGGKSYLVVNGILRLPALRYARVLFIDDKGADPVTMPFGEPIRQYPLGFMDRHRRRDRQEQPEHYRLIVPEWRWMPGQSAVKAIDAAREVVARALDAWYREASTDRPSIVVYDEAAAMTGASPPSLNLAPMVKTHWRKLRYKGGSVIALTQAPLGVPSEFYHQPTHLYVGPILDQEQRRRLREIGGNSKVIERCVEQLRDREFLFLGHKGRHMHVTMVGRN